jgi:hypothetical protein
MLKASIESRAHPSSKASIMHVCEGVVCPRVVTEGVSDVYYSRHG